jgi:hypothetical protein
MIMVRINLHYQVMMMTTTMTDDNEFGSTGLN